MGALELAAMATEFDIPICVWRRDGAAEMHNKSSKAPVCHLWYHLLHYEWCEGAPDCGEVNKIAPWILVGILKAFSHSFFFLKD